MRNVWIMRRKIIWMIFCSQNTANFHIKVSRETGDDNCACHVTVFDNIAVARADAPPNFSCSGLRMCEWLTLIFDPHCLTWGCLAIWPPCFDGFPSLSAILVCLSNTVMSHVYRDILAARSLGQFQLESSAHFEWKKGFQNILKI